MEGPGPPISACVTKKPVAREGRVVRQAQAPSEVAGAQKPGAGRLEGKTGAALAWGALAWVTVAGSGME